MRGHVVGHPVAWRVGWLHARQAEPRPSSWCATARTHGDRCVAPHRRRDDRLFRCARGGALRARESVVELLRAAGGHERGRVRAIRWDDVCEFGGVDSVASRRARETSLGRRLAQLGLEAKKRIEDQRSVA